MSITCSRSRNNSGSMATGCGLKFESRYGWDISPLHVVQTGSGTHPPIPMDNTGSFTGREADHSPPTSAEIKNKWIYTLPPPLSLSLMLRLGRTSRLLSGSLTVADPQGPTIVGTGNGTPEVPELPSVWGYSWATLSPGVINTER
jgi:hypothetical protein